MMIPLNLSDFLITGDEIRVGLFAMQCHHQFNLCKMEIELFFLGNNSFISSG